MNPYQYDDLVARQADQYAATKYEILRDYLRGQPRLRILNAGCGSGDLSFLLANDGHQVLGIDPVAEYIDLARRHAALLPNLSCTFAVSAIEDYRAPSPFDAVIATDVLEHIADDRAAFDHLASFLRPGGLILITVPAGQWLFGYHDEQLGHFRRYSRRGLRRLVQHCCHVEEVRYFGFSLLPVCLAYSKLLRRPYPVAQSGDAGRRPLTARLLKGLLHLDRKLPAPLGTSVLMKARKQDVEAAAPRRLAS
jgi:SAM-dependent methyltransferase